MKQLCRHMVRAIMLVGGGTLCLGAHAATLEPLQRSDVDLHERLAVADLSVQHLEFDAKAPSKVMTVDLVLDGQARRVILRPYDMSPDMVVLEQVADGAIRYVPPMEPRTYRGEIEGEPGSLVAASITPGGGLTGIVFSGGDMWGFQPLTDVEPGADPSAHAVYRQDDIVVPESLCGVMSDIGPRVEGDDEGGVAGGGFSGGVQVDIAFDADVEFFQLNGSSTPNTVADITAVLNGVEALYQREVGIAFRITTILVRTVEPDPYSSNVAGTLLGQFQSHWNAAQGAIVRDHAQLMTGKDLGTTIGVAFLNQICSNLAASYSVVESRWQLNFAARISLSGHEIGHSFNAEHCDGSAANCGMMCSGISGCPGSITSFDTFNTPRVIAKRNTAACVTALSPLGACCVGSTCTQVSAGECAAAGGTWTQGLPCTTRSSYSASPGVAIPDGNGTGVTTNIVVPDSFTISDLNVRVNIAHTWVGDLVVELSHSGGPFRRLVDRIGVPAQGQFGCPNNNLSLWLDDEGTGGPVENICYVLADNIATPASGPSFVPQNTTSFFDGQNASGTWTLRVIDLATPDPGTITSWTLDFERAGTTVCVPTGSCCVGTACTQTTQSDCNTAGGVWTSGQACFTDAVFSANPNLVIPDGPPAGVSHTINVPANFTISDLNLNLVINHTWVGDLTVRLQHGATIVTLIDRPGVPASQFGCDGNNYNIVLDDEGVGGSIENLCGPGGVNPTSPPNYTPNNPLSAFDGQNISGNWMLTVTDTVTPDGGTLVSWGLVVPDPATNPCSSLPCPANIVTSGASATQVDIDDLLAVISGWGPCPSPPTACPANIVTSGASATQVDIDDLLAVISAWGPCP